MRHLLVILPFIAACGSKTPAVQMVPNAHTEGTFLHLKASDIAAASDASLSHTIRNACDGLCDRVYVDIEPQTPPVVLQRLSEVAGAIEPRPRVYLVPSNAKRIELVLGDATCTVEVGVESSGAYVIREGERLAPDPTCSRWDATICRGTDDLYDWPRLRSEVGLVDEICVAFAATTVAELPAIHETLRQPRVRIVAPRQPTASLERERLTAVILGAGADLQWCLDGEVVAEEQVPMEATLRLAVHTDGTVTRAEVIEGTRTTSQFETCITDVVERLRFEPPGPKPVVVEVSLAFEPGADGPKVSQRD